MANLEVLALDPTVPQIEAPQTGNGYSMPRLVNIAPEVLTGSTATPSVAVAQTWDTTGTPTALQVNVTDTASNAASKLLDLQVGGASKISVDKAGVLAFQTDLFLNRDAANTFAQRNGVNAQVFRVHNTYTNTSNYERLSFSWSGNVASIVTEFAGTGVQRPLFIGSGGKGVSIDPIGNSIALSAGGSCYPVVVSSGINLTGWNSGGDYLVFGPSNQAGNSNRAGSNVVIYPLGGSGNGTAGQVLLYASLAAASGTAGHTFEFGVKTFLPATGTPGLQFGGVTSSFPAIKRSGTALQVRLADDSGNAPLSASSIRTATAYTVATLPTAGSQGTRAHVTDALAPTFLSTVVGGGAVVTSVFDNGTVWVCG